MTGKQVASDADTAHQGSGHLVVNEYDNVAPFDKVMACRHDWPHSSFR